MKLVPVWQTNQNYFYYLQFAFLIIRKEDSSMPAKEKQAPLRYIAYIFIGVTLFLGAMWGLLLVLDIFNR
ncbi:hypothetical protein J5TS2_46230 [Brevibacillus halotolerans]|nr:hypothetical protein J5TS2_46230 [Brevibacillus halotolerans]